eukprot:361284-Chlamydomonas_euryale.AAC.2
MQGILSDARGWVAPLGRSQKYTEAITLDPSMAVLYVNRAMAYRRKEDWAQVRGAAGSALHTPSHLSRTPLSTRL